MKRILLLGAALLLVVCLTACGDRGTATAWQEQYDLGIRYLSEGNYEEAIIAFTAAIEIDPKQAPAYVGRGQAYVFSGETEDNLAAAQADYETAIELDDTNPDAYLGLADVYICRGDYKKALEVLQQGLEKTGNNKSIADKITEMQNSLQIETSETILFSEYIIDNFVEEEEFAIGGIPFYKLTLDQAASYLPKLDKSDYSSDNGYNIYNAYSNVIDYAFDGVIACFQKVSSQTIDQVVYLGYVFGSNDELVKDERVKPGIRDITFGDSMDVVLEKIGIPANLAEILVKSGLYITIDANRDIDGEYGRITIEKYGGPRMYSYFGKDALAIYIRAGHSDCVMVFLEDQLIELELFAK